MWFVHMHMMLSCPCISLLLGCSAHLTAAFRSPSQARTHASDSPRTNINVGNARSPARARTSSGRSDQRATNCNMHSPSSASPRDFGFHVTRHPASPLIPYVMPEHTETVDHFPVHTANDSRAAPTRSTPLSPQHLLDSASQSSSRSTSASISASPSQSQLAHSGEHNHEEIQ